MSVKRVYHITSDSMWKAFWKAAMATAMLALMVCEVDGALSLHPTTITTKGVRLQGTLPPAVLAIAIAVVPKASATFRCPFSWDDDGDITTNNCISDIAKLNSKYYFGSNGLYCGGSTINSRDCSNAKAVLMRSGDFSNLVCDGASIEATNGATCEQQIKNFNAIVDAPPPTVTFEKCNGLLDPDDCKSRSGLSVDAYCKHDAAKSNCPALCDSCVATTTATTTTTIATCNGYMDPADTCRSATSESCSNMVVGPSLQKNCPVLCGTCKPALCEDGGAALTPDLVVQGYDAFKDVGCVLENAFSKDKLVGSVLKDGFTLKGMLQLVYVGDNAFKDFPWWMKVEGPMPKLREIGKNAFSVKDTSSSWLTLDGGAALERVGTYAFYGFRKVTVTGVFPKWTQLGHGAFYKTGCWWWNGRCAEYGSPNSLFDPQCRGDLWVSWDADRAFTSGSSNTDYLDWVGVRSRAGEACSCDDCTGSCESRCVVTSTTVTTVTATSITATKTTTTTATTTTTTTTTTTRLAYMDKPVCEVCTCSNQDIACTDNSAETLPEKVFAGLTVLGDMRISMDKLTKLSVGQFAELTVGGTFSIDGCGSMSELPAKLFNSATFRSLDLVRTKIKTLPANLYSGCTVHQILTLSHNKELETLPGKLFFGLTLKTSGDSQLKIQANPKLATLPARLFDGLTGGIKNAMILGNNGLKTIPGYTFSGLSATKVTISDNSVLEEIEVQAFDGLIANVIQISSNAVLEVLLKRLFYGCTLERMPASMLGGKTEILIAGNKIASIEAGFLEGLVLNEDTEHHVDTLQLYDMPSLTSLPARLLDGMQINLIFMQKIGVKTLPTNLFHGLTKNKDTWIRYNSALESIPTGLLNGAEMNEVRIYDSAALVNIEEQQFKNSTVSKVYISVLAANCCGLEWLMKSIASGSSEGPRWYTYEGISFSGITCAAPATLNGIKLLEVTDGVWDPATVYNGGKICSCKNPKQLVQGFGEDGKLNCVDECSTGYAQRGKEGDENDVCDHCRFHEDSASPLALDSKCTVCKVGDAVGFPDACSICTGNYYLKGTQGCVKDCGVDVKGSAHLGFQNVGSDKSGRTCEAATTSTTATTTTTTTAATTTTTTTVSTTTTTTTISITTTTTLTTTTSTETSTTQTQTTTSTETTTSTTTTLTDTSTITTTVLVLFDACDPRKDACDPGNNLVCNPQSYQCLYTTSTIPTTTTTSKSSTTTSQTTITDTSTTTTTTATTTTTTTTHPCNRIKCAVICDGECGWSRAEGQCKLGLITSQSMIDSKLGDCSVHIPENVARSAGSGGAIGGAAGGGLFLIAVIAVSICVVRKKRAPKTGLAAANYNRAPPTSSTPMPYGGARPTTATAAAYTNAALTTADAGPVYEEIADAVPAITATAATTTTDDTYGLDTLYGAGQAQPSISALYLEPTSLSTFQNADGVVYSTYADAASPTNTQPRVVLHAASDDTQPPSRQQQQQQPRSDAATDDDDNYEMPSDQVLSIVVNGIEVPTRLSRTTNAKGSPTSSPVSSVFKSALTAGGGESRSDKSRPVPMLNLNLQSLEQGDDIDSTLVVRPFRSLSTPRTFGVEETVLGTPSSMKASYFFASSTQVEGDDKPPSRQTSNV